jgi:predicted AAA+ superfamily ATPase
MSGERPVVAGHSPVDVPAYVDEILRSGFPGIRGLPERARRFQLDGYIARIIERELPENGVRVRRPSALRAWLAAYGAATATDASYTTILDAATAGDHDKPARGTVDSYREQLTRLFILEPLPAWIPVFNPIARLTHAPRHHLVDPAIAARLVGVGREGLLRGDRAASATGTWLGALFESLATQSIRVYADALDATTAHLRTKDGAREIDLIVEGPGRRVVAIEVKLAPTVSDHDVRHLNWLETRLGEQLADRLVITTGPVAYRRADGVAVIPLALLGP